MFWAVQGMAAELSTGALVMQAIQEERKPISMLVAQNRAEFVKKARGRISFTCEEGVKVRDTIRKAIETGEGQTVWLTSRGVDREGNLVSIFQFEWTVKLRS